MGSHEKLQWPGDICEQTRKKRGRKMYSGERVFLAEETENAKALRQEYWKFKENQGYQCVWS